MKKGFILLLALTMLLSVSACAKKEPSTTPTDVPSPAATDTDDVKNTDNPEPTPAESPDPDSTAEAEPTPETAELALDGPNTVDGAAEYTLVTAYETNDVAPPKPASVYTHYEASSGKKYVVFVADVKNLHDANVLAGDLLAASLTVNGNQYGATCVVEEDGGASFGYSNTTAIAALETARLYYLFQVPAEADTESMTFSLSAGEDTRTADVGLSAFESRRKTFAPGQEITDGETISATVDEVYFSTTLYPPRPGSYYSYYEAAAGKTYLIVKVTAKNLKGSDMKYDAIAGVSCVYNDKYKYTAFACLEEDGGADLNGYPSQYAIAPLDSGVVYYLTEVPAEVENGSVEISLYMAGEYYYYTIG